jgi:hypothetical protein
VAGECGAGIASILDAEDGVGECGEVAEVKAADRAVELIEAVGSPLCSVASPTEFQPLANLPRTVESLANLGSWTRY